MAVDPRHLDSGAADPAATQEEPEYPTAGYPTSGYPGAASPGAVWPTASYRAAPQPGAPQPGAAHPGAAHPALPHARMLAASADRERAIDVLKAGFAEGRLTQAEYNDRVGQVYASRTYGELAALVGDLPAGPLGGPAHYQAGGYPVRRPVPRTNSLAVASLACGLGEFLTFGLTAIPAIILGHMARRQMRETGERGGGMAIAGQFLGWAAFGVFFALSAGLIVAASKAGHPTPAAPFPGPPKAP